MAELLKTELLGLDNQELTEFVQNAGQADYRDRQLFDALYRQRISSIEQITTLPLNFRAELAKSTAVGLPKIEKKFSSADGTIRYLFAFADGESVETVWMPEGDGGEAGDGSDSGDPLSNVPTAREKSRGWVRATICVSSQAGCAVDCQFCLTAALGLKRNLTAGEIVGQVIAVLNDRHVTL